MKPKLNVNTVVLLLTVVVLVIIIVVGITVTQSVRQLVRPLQETERAIEDQLQAILEPTPTIISNPVTIIHEMTSLSRLETASYLIEKVIIAESGQGPLGFLFGDRLILVAHGQVIAGVDLQRIAPEDITVTADGTVIVALPSAEIFVTSLDNQQSYILDRDTGVIGLNPALETDARRAAEDQILDAALEDGILAMAQRNGQQTLGQLIRALGYQEVFFTTEPAIVVPTPTG